MNYELGLIGYPIQHSLSPWIHKHFLRQTKLKGSYSLFEIDVNQSFSEAMKQLKASNLTGFNVTVPYKEKIIPYIDELDHLAEQVGAVNTVLSKEGKWVGYNTDGIGYVRSLLNEYPSLEKNKKLSILLLGAGGAAKGIFTALVQTGFEEVTIANRTIEKAEEIIVKSSSSNMGRVITLNEAEEQLAQYDVIIQTSSVGMKPNESKQIIPLRNIKASVVVSDIVYQPLMTSFLKEAKSLGANIHFGHTMLLNQALHAFEIWTNKSVNLKGMDLKLREKLEG